jgi:nucleotide-binding universal stress UspA family protein
MRQEPIEAIAHPTDFSEASAEAFAHALRLALAFRCRLDVLHVKSGDGEWSSFPHVRETLARWGLLSADADHAQVQQKLGIEIRKIEIEHYDPLRGVAAFLLSHRPDLVVMATRGAQGLSRFMSESVSEGIAQKTNLPALFLGPNARPFVDSKNGRLHLKSAVIPVGRHPSPSRALTLFHRLFGKLGLVQRYVHVGDERFELMGATGKREPVTILEGSTVEAILLAASSYLADLLVMPTAGRHGFLDALRGSTTEQVLRRAACALLALPA